MYALSLIDAARKTCKSDAEVARMIGVSAPYLNRVKRGKAKLSPECAAILASAIGDDPVYAVQAVMLENAAPELATRLQRAFRWGAPPVAGAVAGFLLALAPCDATARESITLPLTSQSIHWRASRRRWAWLYRLVSFGTRGDAMEVGGAFT